MDFKYNQNTLVKIETLYKESGYVIRYEKGSFNAGYCILKDKKVVVLNKFFDVEARINCLIDIITEVEIDINTIEDDKLKKIYLQLSQQKLEME